MRLRITGKELKTFVQWGLAGIGTFLVFEPIQNMLSEYLRNGGIIGDMIHTMFIMDWRSMAVGAGIVLFTALIFKIE